MDDSVPGHGHAAGALGNSSDTTGAKGEGGAGSNSGTAGRKDERAAGEGSDTTSGAPSGRWDATPEGKDDARSQGHARDRTMTGRVAKVGEGSVTIRSQQGEAVTLKLVPETTVTRNGKEAARSDLKEGQDVRASFSSEAGEDVAVKIDLQPASGANGRKPAAGSTRSGSSGAATPESGPPPRQ
jgi:hypothetical protein